MMRASLMRAGAFGGRPVKVILTKRPPVPGAQVSLRV
jgi:hypothetical protein